MKIKVKIKRTKDDFYLAYKTIIKSKVRRKTILAIIGIFLIYYLVIFWSNNGDITTFDRTMVFLFVTMFAFFLLSNFILRFRTRLLFKKNSNLSNEEEITFDKEGLTIASQNAEGKVKWSIYIKALITKETILLFPNTMIFQNYPKRFFSDSEYQELSNLVQTNIKDCKEI